MLAFYKVLGIILILLLAVLPFYTGTHGHAKATLLAISAYYFVASGVLLLLARKSLEKGEIDKDDFHKKILETVILAILAGVGFFSCIY